MNDSSSPPTAAPWHAAYPSPKSDTVWINRTEVLKWLQAGQESGKDFMLIDLRRADHEGGSIRGSINLPAQSLHSSIPTLYDLFSRAGIKNVVWYCGSSRGRGSRAAGWFADYIAGEGDNEMTSCALEEGIKGWASVGGDHIRFMDEWDETAWKK